jgi:hypothetical protein
MKLWWLEFRGGRTVIIEGESLNHARLLATVNEFARASQFVNGYSIDPHLVELIPEDCIARKLSPTDADELLEQLRRSESMRAKSMEPVVVARTSASAAAAHHDLRNGDRIPRGARL